MKASRTFASNALVILAVGLITTVFCTVSSAQIFELHGGGISKTVVGTNTVIGTNVARVGDYVTATITIQNVDQVVDAGVGKIRRADSLRLDMVMDLVMHGMHTVTSPNLLDGEVKLTMLTYGGADIYDPPTGTNYLTLTAPHSVTLTNLGDSLSVSHTYQVLPGEDDPSNLVNGFLTDLAVAMGADLRNCQDCPTAPGQPDDFLLQFPGGILVNSLPVGALGDFVWDDKNHNGIQDAGEPGLAGMTVALQDCAGNLIKAIQTDANGKYLFTNLTASTYKVFFVPPPEYVFTLPNAGADRSKDSDPDTNGFTACITLGLGETNLNVDAGFFRPLAAVGDFVWNDLNRDGRQSPGEPGLSALPVVLEDCAGNVVTATVTGPDGKYLITDVPAGNYRVRFGAPAGFTFTQPNIGSDDLDSDADATGLTACISLVAGQTNLTVDAGLFAPPGTIGDFVWNDTNRDGRQSAGELGIPGVRVSLQDCAGTELAFTNTAADGRYLFSDIAAGSYRVRFTPPANFIFTTANVGSDDLDSDADANGITTCFALTSGQVNLTIDAGLFAAPSSIGDFVWNDVNRDGRQSAGELGIPGVRVSLQTCAGVEVAFTNTAADGRYLFSDVAAGSYRVSFAAPANYTFTASNIGSDDLDSDADASGNTACFTLTAGEVNLTLDAGLFLPTGSIGDFVWNDLNRDGRQSAGESGIPGVRVSLQTCAGVEVAFTNTAADGRYLFSDVAAGSYRVRFTAPTDYTFTTPNIGSDDLDSDADGSGTTTCFTLTAGQVNLTLDAGLFLPSSSIGDFVWDDRNHDGRQTAGEPGIPGVRVSLQNCAGVELAFTNTAADGKYLFTDLAAGSYRIVFSQPAGFVFTTPNIGSDDRDSDPDTNGFTACFTLTSGQVNLTIDAGLFAPTSAVGDFVWKDLNGDGCQDFGEPGIPGVTVTLQTCAGNVVGSTSTDANGKYLFDGLAAGSYRVVFSLPSGSAFTVARVAACGDDLDSDPDPATGVTPCFTLAAGQRNLNIDAGLIAPECGAIGDFVWEDRNCNGIQDSGEPGIPGVQIYLTDCAGGILNVAFTDANGRYVFANLAAGDYRVVFLAQANLTFAPKVAGNPTRDSNADSAGLTECFTLGACETNLTVDAGLCPPAGECCVREVTRAISDQTFNPHGSDHAMWIPGISTNLIFYPDPGSFRECPDGTATLTGRVTSLTNLNAGFDVNVVFSGRRTNAPAGSPKIDLDDEAYEDHGGPVDTDSWYYYTVFNGTLTGFGLYEGAVLTLTRTGPAFQIGVGANNKNVNFGASGWFDWTRQSQPNAGRFPASGKGDIDIDLGPCIPEVNPNPQPLPRPVLNSLVQSVSGQKRLTVDGVTGHYYLIECSADLSTWKPLAIVQNTSGVLTFSDRAANSRCFYRVKMVP